LRLVERREGTRGRWQLGSYERGILRSDHTERLEDGDRGGGLGKEVGGESLGGRELGGHGGESGSGPGKERSNKLARRRSTKGLMRSVEESSEQRLSV
jgi:hypothetical protein